MYFVAISTLRGWKAVSRVLYPTKIEAKHKAWEMTRRSTHAFKVFDAEHDPGKSILKCRYW